MLLKLRQVSKTWWENPANDAKKTPDFAFFVYDGDTLQSSDKYDFYKGTLQVAGSIDVDGVNVLIDEKLGTFKTTYIDPLTLRVTTVEGVANTNKTGIATNKTNIATNKADISGLKTRVTTVEGVADKNKTDIATNKTNIATNKTNITNLTTRVTTAEGKVTVLEGKVNTNTGKITALEGRVTTNEGNIDDLGTELGTVSGSLDNLTQVVEALKGSLVVIGFLDKSKPTSAELSAFVQSKVSRAPRLGDVVYDKDGNEWYFNSTNKWDNLGQSIISLATTLTAGIVVLSSAANYDQLTAGSNAAITNDVLRKIITTERSRDDGLYLKLAGGTMAGVIKMGNNAIQNLKDGRVGTKDAVTMDQYDVHTFSLDLEGGLGTGQGAGESLGLTPEDQAKVNAIKLDGPATQYLNRTGAYSTPPNPTIYVYTIEIFEKDKVSATGIIYSKDGNITANNVLQYIDTKIPGGKLPVSGVGKTDGNSYILRYIKYQVVGWYATGVNYDTLQTVSVPIDSTMIHVKKGILQ